jgi:vacuolar protein sorting-associated protein 72
LSTEPAAPPKCIITNKPARYKDPKTGLPYYDSRAYKEIQKLQSGDYKWSRLVGAWVGTASFAAQGVPARFLDPDAPAPPKPSPPTVVKQEPGVATQDQPVGTPAPTAVPTTASSTAPIPTPAPSSAAASPTSTPNVAPPTTPTSGTSQKAQPASQSSPIANAPVNQATVSTPVAAPPSTETKPLEIPPSVAAPTAPNAPPPISNGTVAIAAENPAPVAQQTGA